MFFNSKKEIFIDSRPSDAIAIALRFKVDIFNILGQDGVDDMNEYGESGGPTSYPYKYYQLPLSYQYPRSIRLGIEARF